MLDDRQRGRCMDPVIGNWSERDRQRRPSPSSSESGADAGAAAGVGADYAQGQSDRPRRLPFARGNAADGGTAPSEFAVAL